MASLQATRQFLRFFIKGSWGFCIYSHAGGSASRSYHSPGGQLAQRRGEASVDQDLGQRQALPSPVSPPPSPHPFLHPLSPLPCCPGFSTTIPRGRLACGDEPECSGGLHPLPWGQPFSLDLCLCSHVHRKGHISPTADITHNTGNGCPPQLWCAKRRSTSFLYFF